MKTIIHNILRFTLAAALFLPAAPSLAVVTAEGLDIGENPIPPYNEDIESRRQDGINAMPCFLCPFVQKGDIDEVNQWLQMHPLISNRPDTVDFDVNGVDRKKRTALFFAARMGHPGIVRAILDRTVLSPDINTANIRDRTPLFIAAFNGNLETVRALLEYNPNLEFAAFNGTPLFIALWRGHYETAKLLGNHGAVYPEPRHIIEFALNNDMNAIVKDAVANLSTPVEFASGTLFTAVSLTSEQGEGLIAAAFNDNADCRETYQNGRTALSFAKQQGNTGIAALLEEAGCTDNLTDEACHAEDKYRRGNECFSCRGGEIRVGNECEPDFAGCHANNEIYNYEDGECHPCNSGQIRFGNECVELPPCGDNEERADNGINCVCIDDHYRNAEGICVELPSCGGNEERADNGITCVCADDHYRNAAGACVRPRECRADQVRAADGIHCKCPSERYDSGDKCILPCFSCSIYDGVSDSCKCDEANGWELNNRNECVKPPKCGGRQVLTPDKRSCICQAGLAFMNGWCEPCGGGKIPNADRTECVCPANLPYFRGGRCRSTATVVPSECTDPFHWQRGRTYCERGNCYTTPARCVHGRGGGR